MENFGSFVLLLWSCFANNLNCERPSYHGAVTVYETRGNLEGRHCRAILDAIRRDTRGSVTGVCVQVWPEPRG